ncbi:MAG: hypothetical protein OEZ02_02550 [Anaerolineae bacterium]|nr:hypothetical protein [Anaerolineae bacterium]
MIIGQLERSSNIGWRYLLKLPFGAELSMVFDPQWIGGIGAVKLGQAGSRGCRGEL